MATFRVHFRVNLEKSLTSLCCCQFAFNLCLGDHLKTSRFSSRRQKRTVGCACAPNSRQVHSLKATILRVRYFGVGVFNGWCWLGGTAGRRVKHSVVGHSVTLGRVFLVIGAGWVGLREGGSNRVVFIRKVGSSADYKQ